MEWFLIGFIMMIAILAVIVHRTHAVVDNGMQHAPFNAYTVTAIFAGRPVSFNVMACSSLHAMAKAKAVTHGRSDYITAVRI
jgi:hypothetical protein